MLSAKLLDCFCGWCPCGTSYSDLIDTMHNGSVMWPLHLHTKPISQRYFHHTWTSNTQMMLATIDHQWLFVYGCSLPLQPGNQSCLWQGHWILFLLQILHSHLHQRSIRKSFGMDASNCITKPRLDLGSLCCVVPRTKWLDCFCGWCPCATSYSYLIDTMQNG